MNATMISPALNTTTFRSADTKTAQKTAKLYGAAFPEDSVQLSGNGEALPCFGFPPSGIPRNSRDVMLNNCFAGNEMARQAESRKQDQTRKFMDPGKKLVESLEFANRLLETAQGMKHASARRALILAQAEESFKIALQVLNDARSMPNLTEKLTRNYTQIEKLINDDLQALSSLDEVKSGRLELNKTSSASKIRPQNGSITPDEVRYSYADVYGKLLGEKTSDDDSKAGGSINPITSSEFRSRNEILFQSGILTHTCFNLSDIGEKGSFDVIDLNNNRVADVERHGAGFTKFRAKFIEPCLVAGYDKIKKYALKNKTEVLTQDDIRDPLIETGGLKSGVTIFNDTELIHENQRTIASLVNQVEPFENEAKWAFDLKNQEFVIFKPR